MYTVVSSPMGYGTQHRDAFASSLHARCLTRNKFLITNTAILIFHSVDNPCCFMIFFYMWSQNYFSNALTFPAGLADYTTSPCPVGQYCLNATDNPTPCPSGTYRNDTGARNISDCYLCPAGNFCPLSNSSFWGYACPDGTFCPPGRTAPTVCLPGYYCRQTETQTPCPAGFYCPNGSSSYIPCPEGHYCDPADRCDGNDTNAGACRPKICPLGK